MSEHEQVEGDEEPQGDESSLAGPGGASIDVENVTVSFGDVTAVDDVSVTVERGMVTCIIGPNGSGKTTLLRAVAGLLEPDTGTVERPTDGARPVGYLAQEPSFRPQFTVRETLGFYADLVGNGTDVDAAIERVGLGGVPDRGVQALSGGMTRLLGIAQSTVGDPQLLVLDEPASGLDPMMTRHIGEVVTALADDGRAVLMATHDLASVERIADRVLVLDRGAVAAVAPPDELLADTGCSDLESAMAALVSQEAGEVATREAAPAAANGEEAHDGAESDDGDGASNTGNPRGEHR